MAEKLDVKKTYKSLYAPKNAEFALVAIPPMRYLCIDGVGAPEGPAFGSAVEALY